MLSQRDSTWRCDRQRRVERPVPVVRWAAAVILSSSVRSVCLSIRKRYRGAGSGSTKPILLEKSGFPERATAQAWGPLTSGLRPLRFREVGSVGYQVLAREVSANA